MEAEIGAAERVALNYVPAAVRPKIASFFALDRRLAQIVAGSNEPMLGQMRLAWWRDMLQKPNQNRPAGDAVLDGVGVSWSRSSENLLPLVDAWEIFLLAEELTDDAMVNFAVKRASPLCRAIEFTDEPTGNRIGNLGAVWALADTAAHVSKQEERDLILSLARARIEDLPLHPRVPAPIAVLGALSTRAIARGGRPLMEGRGAAWAALRAGLTGR